MDRYVYKQKLTEIEKLEKRLYRGDQAESIPVSLCCWGWFWGSWGGTMTHMYYLEAYRHGSR
jgi:hypothetical protein